MSKANTKYTSTKHHLSASAEYLSIGYWTNTRFHIERARDSLMVALSGSNEDPREHLVDLIRGAIDDTFDVDWTSEQAAERVVEVLLDDAIPMPVEGGGCMTNPEGFTEELKAICERRCAEAAGEPPCWKLPELTEPCEHITPCSECLADMKGGDV